jgi:hypothetical protein
VIGTSHRASLSLDPAEDAPGAPRSVYKNDSDHEGVVFEMKASDKILTFGLIVLGLIVH